MRHVDALQQLSLSVPLIKFDEEKRLVIGRLASEEPDKAREIMDYERSKPRFQAWSDELARLSKGVNRGNVREMHRKDSAAGHLTEIRFDDDARAIDVIAKITDDGAWQKCLSGTYTGFSVGGGYGDKWTDSLRKDHKRYEAIPREASLVDFPCMPSSAFAELVKMDGTIDRIEMHGGPVFFAELLARAQAEPIPEPMFFGDLAKRAATPMFFSELLRG
ncbi:MAG: hypothetical protein WDN04_13855 [Rhodospirillales bacterium]